ncbi:MAG: hypothetical protein QXU99_00415 [Candidatus Bathyarchaeia archaeon]
MKKTISAFLVAMMVSGLVLGTAHFGAVHAESYSITKPSVPEFTVKLIDSSYDVPASSSIDPYTGQTVTHPSQRVEARTIEIRIKNVPFSPFEIKNGSNTYTVQFYYNIRFKGHFEEEWREPYNPNVNKFPSRDSGLETVISLQGEYSPTEGLKLTPDSAGFYATFPPNAQVDFQVEARIGYIHHVDATPFSADVFEGETSGWSNKQTITIDANLSAVPNSASSDSQKPTASSDQSGLNWTEIVLLAVVGVVVALLVMVVLLINRRRRA